MQFMRMSALLTLLAGPPFALAHPGGLENGCHNDKKAGNYHCHKGANAGKYFSSKEAMLKGAAGTATESIEGKAKQAAKADKKRKETKIETNAEEKM